jgi:hypothetical protein
MLRWTAIVLAAIAFAPTCWATEDCSSVILLSRLHTTKVENKSEVQSSAQSFCSEYRQYRQSSATHDFGASYKFLSATFSSGSADVNEVASKYCSAANDYMAKQDAHQDYIENIAPGAYSAYEKMHNVQ